MNWWSVNRRIVSRVLGAYFLPYFAAIQSISSVTPRSVALDVAHEAEGARLSNPRSVSAERSLVCPLGACSDFKTLEKGPTLHRLKAVDSTCD